MDYREIVSKVEELYRNRSVMILKDPLQEFYSQLFKLSGFGVGALLNFAGKRSGHVVGEHIKNLLRSATFSLEELTPYLKAFIEIPGFCKEVEFEVKGEDYILARVKGSFFAEKMQSNKPVCLPLAGAFAGVLEEITGRSWECKELECQDQGKELCLFEARAK